MAVFMLGPIERQRLVTLRLAAEKAPVDMTTLPHRLATREGKAAHVQQMTEQSLTIPDGIGITFSIETGHPNGRSARHVSITAKGRLPPQQVALIIAWELGFDQRPMDMTWREELIGKGEAINLAQLIDPIGQPVGSA
jgi:hypothetical protein